MRILRHLWQPPLLSLGRLSSPAQLLHLDDGSDNGSSDDGDNNDGSGGCDGGCDDGRGDGGTNVTKTNPGKGFGLIIIF